MKNFDEELSYLYSCCDLELTKKEKKILYCLDANEALSYYDLMELVDIKPSSFNKHVEILKAIGFIEEKEEELLDITDLAIQFLYTDKKERKENKKFLKFVESLSDEEYEELKKIYEESAEDEEIVIEAIEEEKLN